MSHLENLGNRVSVPLKPDKEGYLGRECPVKDCLGYFKITPGTGIKGPAPCYCPYCGHCGDHNTFVTGDQIEYARSVVLRKITGAITKDLKSLEFDHKPKGLFGIGFSMKVQESAPLPIRYYREKELQTEVICDRCTLRYAIYGVFGWCPDCGIHNSLQILGKNLELAKKELVLAKTAEADLANHLTEDALENAVSTFDGFGRAICAKKNADIRFQNIVAARQNVQERFGFDFADSLNPPDWDCVCKVFQKRHLLAHKMGVVDMDYLKKARDPVAIIGHRINVSSGEVELALGFIEKLGRRLFIGLFPAMPSA